jgi:hypothetical protein
MAIVRARAVVLLLLLGSTPALAQWHPGFTSGIGKGYANLALSQAILNRMRANAQAAAANAEAAAAGAQAAAANGQAAGSAAPPATGRAAGAWAGAGESSGPNDGLTYIPDPSVSDRIREQMIDSLGQSQPELRTQMQRSFAGNAVLKEFDQHMSTRGYSSRNVADDMAELLVSSWEIITGGAAEGAQVQGAHRQVRDIFLANSRLRAMTNTERQEWAEQIAYQVVISSLAHREYLRSGDRAQLAKLRQAVTAMLQQQGIDLTNLRLTPAGFHR